MLRVTGTKRLLIGKKTGKQLMIEILVTPIFHYCSCPDNVLPEGMCELSGSSVHSSFLRRCGPLSIATVILV
jgi:hypothetical protein